MQELRYANCIGELRAVPNGPVLAVVEVKKGVQEVRGWGHRAKPAGAGQATAPGKAGGQAASEQKVAAARANGRLGWRPRKARPVAVA